MQKAFEEWNENKKSSEARANEIFTRDNEHLQEELNRARVQLSATIADNRKLRQAYHELKASKLASAEAASRAVAAEEAKVKDLEQQAVEHEAKYATSIRLLDDLQKLVKKEKNERQMLTYDAKNSTREASVYKKTNSLLIKERDRLSKDLAGEKHRGVKTRLSFQKFRRDAAEKNKELLRQNQSLRERVQSLELSMYGRSITIPLHKPLRSFSLLGPTSARAASPRGRATKKPIKTKNRKPAVNKRRAFEAGKR
jgi:hypothetical protein